MANRRLVYSPVVAADRKDGYSADEVNRMIMTVEQTFETCLRQVEERLSATQETLEQRQDELAALANLADRRSAAAEAELTRRAADLAARDRSLAERDEAVAEARAALDRQIATAREDAATTAANEARLTEKIGTLEAALNQMRQSGSWRVTRPLRWLAQRTGRG